MSGEVAIVGRETEVAVGLGALGAPGGLLVVCGEPGIGRSRLVRELVARRSAAGCLTPVGRCLPLGGELPLLPVVEVVRALADVDGGQLLAGVLQTLPEFVGHELSRLVPHLGRSGWAGPGEGWERERLFASLCLALGEMATRRALGVVVEDVHWADTTTLDFLCYLAAHSHPRPGVVVTSRPTSYLTEATAAWMRSLSSLPGTARRDLRPLTREAVADFAAAVAAGPLTEAEVDQLYRRSHGNPFFVEQLLATGTGPGEEAAAGPPASRPTALFELLRSRARGVDGASRDLLDVLSVAARGLTEDQLASASGQSRHVVRAGLKELAAADLVEASPDGAITVVHVLLAEAIEAGLLPGERAELHRAVAAVLDEGGSPWAAEAADHWRRGGDGARELAALVSAAGRAEALSCYAEAVPLWERAATRAADVEDHGLDRVGLYAKAADAAYRSGQDEPALALVTSARSLITAETDPLIVSRALVLAGRLAFARDLEEGLAVSREAVEVLNGRPPTEELAEALFWLQRALYSVGRARDGTSHLLRALEVAREVGALLVAVKAQVVLSHQRCEQGCTAEGLAEMAQVREVAEASGDPRYLLWVAGFESDLWLRLGRLAEAAARGRSDLQRLRAAGLAYGFAASVLASNVIEALLELGRTEEADAFLPRSALPPLSAASWMTRTTRSRIEVCLGDLVAAGQDVQDALRVVQDLDLNPDLRRELAAERADLLIWRGHPEQALTVAVETLVEVGYSEQGPSTSALLVLAARAAADTAAVSGRRRVGAEVGVRAARSALDQCRARLAHDPFQVSDVHVVGAALRLSWEAELSRADGRSDAALWRAVAQEWDRLGRRHRSAYAHWRLAEALVSVKAPRPQVATALGEAMSRARGHMPLQQGIAALAQAARIPLDAQVVPADGGPAPNTHPFDLTDRELQVLRLVALGRRNAEIGRELFVSPKTVSVHVTSIMRKLNATNRSQAAWVARQAGLDQWHL